MQSISEDVITLGQLSVRYFRDGSKENQMGAFELVVPPGSNVPPPHSHSLNEEMIYVLEGKLQYSVGRESRDLMPGESMFTPKGEVHGFSNPFATTARALVVLTPDIGAGYFQEIAAVVNAGGPPDRAKMMKIMESHGLKVAAPGGQGK